MQLKILSLNFILFSVICDIMFRTIIAKFIEKNLEVELHKSDM